MAILESGDTVLFQGDSITDAGRSRIDDNDMGRGYPSVVAAWFAAIHPAKKVRFINRGISGDRAKDLAARWTGECINLRPNIVSILIGINDTWRRYDSNDPTSAAEYEVAYRNILTRTQQELGAKIIIIEPFVLPVPEDRKAWREDLDPKITVARKLAREFNAIYVPMDGIFSAVSCYREPSFWLPDGVHPSPAGHSLIAKNWLTAVGEM